MLLEISPPEVIVGVISLATCYVAWLLVRYRPQRGGRPLDWGWPAGERRPRRRRRRAGTPPPGLRQQVLRARTLHELLRRPPTRVPSGSPSDVTARSVGEPEPDGGGVAEVPADEEDEEESDGLPGAE